MTSMNRRQMNETADQLDKQAARYDEAARDAAQFACNATDQLQRDQAAAMARQHRENATDARANAEALRSGETPYGWQ
ncbi:hypothetical protein [Streptomyces sp. NPDC004658]|uniref:hypothetical protein n=1 Tax=Streptomyces sp. NPDC004658 TaxID=3154672 RepID=UPI0033BFB383